MPKTQLSFEKIVLRNTPELELLIKDIKIEFKMGDDLANTKVVLSALRSALNYNRMKDITNSLRNKYEEIRLALENHHSKMDSLSQTMDISRNILIDHDKV